MAPLKLFFRDRIFTDKAFSTFLTEVESIINSRPLTTGGNNINCLEPVTPNNLLIGKLSPNYKPCIFQEQDISLRKNGKQFKQRLTCFRKSGWKSTCQHWLKERSCKWKIEIPKLDT